MDWYDMQNRFTHHPPADEHVAHLHALVRRTFEVAAHKINDLLEDSREKSLAITKLEEAMFWANASVARNNSNNGGKS